MGQWSSQCQNGACYEIEIKDRGFRGCGATPDNDAVFPLVDTNVIALVGSEMPDNPLNQIPTIARTPFRGHRKSSDILRFKVSLSKEGTGSFGLAHMPMEDGSNSLQIIELRLDGESPVSKWNADQRKIGSPECALMRGDRIVSVGFVNDLDGMRELLRQDHVTFTVERWPDTTVVYLHKRQPSDKFGMVTDVFSRDDGWTALRLSRISSQGLLLHWNKVAEASRRFFDVVCPWSEIVRVGALRGDPDRMQEKLKMPEEEGLEIEFKRPDPSLFIAT
mmetsp:Transcript_1985/g.3316  ORF Transcript_1985/g.3316 Transcript_1985/m.3316 type:complete len:277 (-) Transcript_1985:49-879(-)